jgi:hypothetical protein
VAELIVGIVLAAAAVYVVLRPILTSTGAAPGTQDGGAVDDGEDPEDDLSPRAVALRALKEIEFDRATGKLADADYAALEQKYTAEALAALRAEEPGPSPGVAGPGAARAPAVAARSDAAPRLPHCPTHGPRPESDAAFCSACGRRLAAAPGYCARCGAALEREASYCHACGTRVAA